MNSIDKNDKPTQSLIETDEAFLRDLQQHAYRFFVEAAAPETGFVSDRSRFDGSSHGGVASSAACGFALAAYSIASQTPWLSSFDQASSHAEKLLLSLWERAPHERGFLYHFFDRVDGKRAFDCEASSIDTALLLAGAMVAAVTFGRQSRIGQLADELCNRVEWDWMLTTNGVLRMGWKPETGHLDACWDRYSELMILVLIAIGAKRHRIPGDCWTRWRRQDQLVFNGRSFLHYPPLFVHQYSHAYFDFRNVVSPSGRSYWENSITAHEAQIDFMLQLGQRYPDRFGHYGEDLWGLTSSESIHGYNDWGGPYQQDRIEPDRNIDGSVVPSAAGGALAIVPGRALRTLQYQKQTFGPRVYGPFGFVNAHHPGSEWVSRDVIGIDTGITLLMAENLRTGFVWKQFMQHEIARDGLHRAGFTTSASRML